MRPAMEVRWHENDAAGALSLNSRVPPPPDLDPAERLLAQQIQAGPGSAGAATV